MDTIEYAAGGTGIGVTNTRTAIVEHNVVLETVRSIGLEINLQNSDKPTTSVAAGTDVRVRNNVLPSAAYGKEKGGVDLTPHEVAYGLVQWHNNLQTTPTSPPLSSNYWRIAEHTGDIANGSSAGFLPGSAEPSGVSALLDAGWNGPDTEWPLTSTDHAGLPFGPTRSIGLYQGSGGAAGEVVAVAGDDQSRSASPGTPVILQLDGSGSYATEGIASVQWAHTSGPSDVVIADPTSTVTDVTATGAASNEITLTAVDAEDNDAPTR